MAKDPAFLFYPNDWIGGTMGMSFEEKGAYLEMLMYQFNKGAFTEKNAISVLRDNALWDSIKNKFQADGDFYFNKRLRDEKEKRQNFTESRRQSRLKCDEDSVRIYIVRDNVRSTYKIGSSVNPVRRYNELSNQITPAIMSDPQGSRDITLIWYSDPVLRTEEKVLHNTFKDKHLSGEWFSLDEDDLSFIFKKHKGVFCERTNERTSTRTNERMENENEDSINIDINNPLNSLNSSKKNKKNGEQFVGTQAQEQLSFAKRMERHRTEAQQS